MCAHVVVLLTIDYMYIPETPFFEFLESPQGVPDIIFVNHDFVLSDTSNTRCISFATGINQLIQGTRYHTISLAAMFIPVKFLSNQATIEVLDDDGTFDFYI